MNHYEVNFIIDPVLSGDEIKSTASTYETMLKDLGCTIVHVNEMGLRQLAYPINKKSSGIYYCIEYTAVNGSAIAKLELALRRDERIMRFLTISLDKYAVQYNEDRRAGKISAYKKKESKKKTFDNGPAPVSAPVAPIAQKEIAPAPVEAAPIIEEIKAAVAEVAAPIIVAEEE
ncbi:MAG: 30S ribosomal protein S6 [Saprospiraceae bacterium]|nr:30S ribosomal protein S6 [Saprospiraceae bacterium]